MKINVDIECTPEEARSFLGLPDVRPLQEAMMKQVQDRMMATLQAMDPETLMKAWMPGGIPGVEQMQRMFWNQVMAGMGKKPDNP